MSSMVEQNNEGARYMVPKVSVIVDLIVAFFDADKADPTIAIDNKMDLYDNCTFIDCNFIPDIGDIYSICIIYQLI